MAHTLLDRSVMTAFPKIELHRHLEGTFHVPTLHRIAMANGLPLPDELEAFREAVQFPRDSEPDFLKFLSKFRNDWYRSKQDVYDIAFESVRDFANDGLFYIELRFSPEHFAFHNDYDRMEITRLVISAADTAAKEADVRIRYLITFNRGKQNQDEMLALYRDLRSLEIPSIVGVDLAGDETGFPPELFPDFFAAVKEDGAYGITIHAGEVSPSTQTWTAIERLFATRIGHGTSTIDDERLQSYLAEHRIVLEQCITSNYQTGSWVDEKNHPLGRLYRAGVPVTINSDDPTIQDTDLTDDYIKAVTYFDLTIDDLIRLNEIAIEGSFLPAEERTTLLADYHAAVAAFRKSFAL